VLFILVGATVFSLAFQGADGPLGRAPADRPAGRTAGLPDRREHLVFFLAFFLDFFEMSFIVVPCWRRWPRSWASTWSGSACCWR
jgi:TRAP-type mannitol/chloroaromatic compound transport system permease large subunit